MSPGGLFLRLLSGAGMLFLALAGHEVGHLAAGRLCGFRFGLIGVGPICLIGTQDGLRLRWLPPSQWGPFAGAYPVGSTLNTSSAALYAAGGPLASGIMAVGATWWAMAGPTGGGLGFARLLAVLSACLCVATVQPFGTGVGVPSDGARVWRLLRGTRTASCLAALFALEGCAAAGIRPCAWDPAVIDLASEVDSPPAYALAAATACLRRAVDCGDMDAARRHAHRLHTTYGSAPRLLRGDAAAEAAVWFSCFETDVATARAYLSDAQGLYVLPYRRCLAEAAVALAAGDIEAARVALVRSSAVITQGVAVVSDFDRQRLEAIRVRVAEARAVT